MKVGIIGASGFVGGELLRLLIGHPDVEVTLATSRQYADDYVYRVHPNLRGFTELQFSNVNPAKAAEQCDLVFTSLPHGTSVKVIPELVSSGVKIIDMSADYRLKDPQAYETWYGYKHPNPALLEKFVLGIPELHREEIKKASYVSAPGCMAVTSILGLAPLVKNNMIDTDHIIVDAKIGSSGAGVKPTMSSHHAERYGVVRPYKPVGHRHTAEIEQELSALARTAVKVSMSAHAVNMVRGILSTCHTFLKREVALAEIWKAYRSTYPSEPFIRFVRDRKGLYRYPDPKIVVGSNFCDIGFETDERNGRIVVLSATDNLLKGAAGIAVQSMNVMMGFDETLGLRSAAIHPA